MSGGKVLVAMSGGVDSSVASCLLKEQGYEVEGAHLTLWDGSAESANDAEAVCGHLGIPFHRVDLCQAFQERVIDYFCSEYLNARTPNPCVRCNRGIKFGLLLDYAWEQGLDFLATGHYARIEEDSRFSCKVLKKGIDDNKDQSYALFALPRERLEHILLPMGFQTKEETRRMAREAGLHVKDRPESQDICFIPDGDYPRFLLERHPDCASPGPILNRRGEQLGMHEGLIHYTIGQRRGIGVAAKRPYYVLELRPTENALIIGFEEETEKSEFQVSGVNWLVPPFENSVEAKVKIRYSSKECRAWIHPETADRALVHFEKPQKAVTPGQAAVFFDEDVVLGGGWIEGDGQQGK
jgi:tRNA-specific 2-thiouridylase